MLTLIMPDETVQSFSSVSGALDTALRQGGIPVRLNAAGTPDHYYTLTQFMGGWLLDSCPLNVVMGQGWAAGQIEALNAAGIRPNCPECAPGTPCGNQFFGPSASSNQVTPPGSGFVPQVVASASTAADSLPGNIAPQTGYQQYTPGATQVVSTPSPAGIEAKPPFELTPIHIMAGVAVIGLLLSMSKKGR